MERVVEGGSEQIRTAVEAFAELCLTTRPQDLFLTPANIRQKNVQPNL